MARPKKKQIDDALSLATKVNALSIKAKVDALCRTEKVDAPNKKKRGKENVNAVNIREVNAHSSMKEKKDSALGKTEKTVNPPSKKERKANVLSMKERKAPDAPTKKKQNVDALTTKLDVLSIKGKVDLSCKTEKVNAPNSKKRGKETKVDAQSMIQNVIDAVRIVSMEKVNAHSSMKKDSAPGKMAQKTVDLPSKKERKIKALSLTAEVDALSIKDKVDAPNSNKQKKKKKGISIQNVNEHSSMKKGSAPGKTAQKMVNPPSTTERKVKALSIKDKVDASCRTEKVDAPNSNKQKKKKKLDAVNADLSMKVDAPNSNKQKKKKKLDAVNVDLSMKEKKASALGKTEKKVDPPSKKETNATDARAGRKDKVVSALSMTQKNVNAWCMKKEVKTPSVTITKSVNPADLRFTQESVSSHFKEPYEYLSLSEALEKIKTRRMIADDFRSLQVISYNGLLWSADNRRLWVFRMAKCSQITVKIQTKMHIRLKVVIGSPSMYAKLSESEFLPRVNKRKNVLPLPAAATVDLHVETQVERQVDTQVLLRTKMHPRLEGATVSTPFVPRTIEMENVLPVPAATMVDRLHLETQVEPQVFMNGSQTLVGLEPVELEMTMEGSVTESRAKATAGHTKRRHFGLIILLPLVFVLKYVFTKRKES